MSMNNRFVNDDALIQRTYDLGETDRIAVLLTRNHGLVSCVCRGVRNPKSKMRSHIDALRHVTVSIRRGRSDLFMMSQVNTLDSFAGISRNLDRIMLGAHFMEISRLFAVQEGANNHLFLHALDGLGNVETFDLAETSLLRLWFEMRLMHTMGLMPQMEFCVRTGEEITPGDHWFSISEGGIVKNIEDKSRLALPDRESPNMKFAAFKVVKLMRIVGRSALWSDVQGIAPPHQVVEDSLGLVTEMLRYHQERGIGRAERVIADIGKKWLSLKS